MERKLLVDNAYETLQAFIVDCTKIFDNARYYNPKENVVSACVEVFEKFFIESVQGVRTELAELMHKRQRSELGNGY